MTKTNQEQNGRSTKASPLWLPSEHTDSAKPRWAVEPSCSESRFCVLTSQELALADLSIEYLVEDVLVRGQPMLLCGPMKSLKTSIVIDLSVALASGGRFLGHFRVPAAVRVLLMSGESGLATLRETAHRVCAAATCELPALDSLYWSDTLPILTNDGDLAALRSAIERLGIDVVVIDPAFLCMPVGDSASNLFRMGEMLAGFSKVCQETGCTPILLHHAKKGGLPDNEPLELQHIAWSGFGEFARQWVLLNRRERFDPGSGLHRLWVSIGGSAGHGSLHGLDVEEGTGHGSREWHPLLLEPAECRQAVEKRRQATRKQQAAAKHELLLKRIIDALRNAPEGDTERGLRDHLSVGKSAVERAIAMGLEQGQLERCTIIKTTNKKPYEAYRLPQSPVEGEVGKLNRPTGSTGSTGPETG